MWIFEVEYYHYDEDSLRMLTIEVEEQFFDTNLEIWLYATDRAYANKKDNEGISKIEFIAC